MCPPDRSPEKCAAHACWEAIRPAIVDFPHAWVACTRDDATSASGCDVCRQNARYALVKSTGFFFFFLRVLAHGPLRLIAVKKSYQIFLNTGSTLYYNQEKGITSLHCISSIETVVKIQLSLPTLITLIDRSVLIQVSVNPVYLFLLLPIHVRVIY